MGIGVVLGSCTGSEGPSEPTLSSIDLSPPSATIQAGSTQQFTATGRFSDGSSASVPVAWSATGGTVSSGGFYTAGSAAGTFQVVATEQGGSVSGAATVTVTATPPVLTGITVSPATVALAPLATQQFTATGQYSGGGTGPVDVTWLATGGNISSSGFYTAGSTNGSYLVTATVVGGSIAGSASVTITASPPNLAGIEISPDTLVRLKPGTTFQYTAIGRLTSGSTAPVTVTWTATSAPPPATAPYNTISAGGIFGAGHAVGSYLVIATQQGGLLADTVVVHVHDTGGETVQGPLFWAPSPGAVYLCTSNHFTDDPVGPAGVATVSALPATGVLLPTVSYSNGPPVIYSQGDGAVAVVCRKVWEAPIGLVGTVQVTVEVASNRPGTGMAKAFVYADPCLTSDCRASYTSQLPLPDPNWTTLPVSVTVTASATEGANIWFKNTYVP